MISENPALPPQTLVMQLLSSKIAAQALTQAAELGVADQLKDGPRSVAELARALAVNEDALYRVLRALAAVGFFSEQSGRVFANNASSEVLRSDVPSSMRAMARWLGEESSWWKAWGHLSFSLRTGESAAEVTFGGTTFDFFGRNPRVNGIFQAAMSDFSALTARAVVEAYDFSGIERIVDVGGGHGRLLSAILAALPQATGLLLDLPEVVAGADPVLHAGGHSGRIRKIAGNFLEGVPRDVDAYIMKHIIHDWDDPRCVKLLQNCRNGLRPGGRVLIVEQVLTDRPDSALAKLLDLEMLVMTPGGRERTEPEFRELLSKAGFELARIVPTRSPVCVVEALAAKPARLAPVSSGRPGEAKATEAQPVPA
jgi:SAM-dependent methyltransferase